MVNGELLMVNDGSRLRFVICKSYGQLVGMGLYWEGRFALFLLAVCLS